MRPFVHEALTRVFEDFDITSQQQKKPTREDY